MSILGLRIMLFIGNPNMINTWSLPLWSPQSSMKRKQLKCAGIMRENHLNITLSTLDLTCIYIMNAKNSTNLIPASHRLSIFYSHHIICVTESFIFTNIIMNSTLKMARTWFLIYNQVKSKWKQINYSN